MCYTEITKNEDGTFSASCSCSCSGPFGVARDTYELADRDAFDHAKANDPDSVGYATYDEYKAANPA